MNRVPRWLIILLLSAWVLVMGNRIAHAEEDLIVSAAASLTNAFGEIGKKFEIGNPGVKVISNFAASGPLLQQIEQGAPVDVFASADQTTMDQAQEKNLVLPWTRKDFASNSLVLIVPMEAKNPIKTLEDLKMKAAARISLGNPETVPAGRYAKEVLMNNGLWEGLLPKFIFGNSVRQVLDYVSRGEVDAGFVFTTDAIQMKDKVRIVLTAEKHKPILYPIAVVAVSQRKELARKFIDFVQGKEGQEILSQFGFGKL
jgi:molybdate transport system substrate-binding protein